MIFGLDKKSRIPVVPEELVLDGRGSAFYRPDDAATIAQAILLNQRVILRQLRGKVGMVNARAAAGQALRCQRPCSSGCQ